MNSPLSTLVMPLCLSICLQVAAAAQDLPEAKRILTMEDGAKVRVVCRLVGQEWQYRNSTGWHSVEARRVRAAHDETVLLKEWRATYKQQQPDHFFKETKENAISVIIQCCLQYVRTIYVFLI